MPKMDAGGLVTAITVIALMTCPHGALASQIKVSLNHAHVLKLDRQVSKVIVGNAKIADVTVADAYTIVLTGRNSGVTNLILLSNDGSPILDRTVLVASNEENTVRLFKSATHTVLSCTPQCEEQP